jgi:YD repeat-containing protein
MIAILIGTIANGQQKEDFMLNQGKESMIEFLPKSFSKQNCLTNTMQNNYEKSKAIIWSFDTLILYNASNSLIARITQTFNNYGNVLIILTETWNSTNNSWYIFGRKSYTYDANGNMLTELLGGENGDGVKNTYTYDANGNMLSSTYEKWENNAWVNVDKRNYTYDANGKMLYFTYEKWQNNAWVLIAKETFSYDINYNMINELSELWQNNIWVNSYKWSYNYNISGNKITHLEQSWQNNMWVNRIKYSYSYNGNNKIITELREDWYNNIWENWEKYTYTYDANGILLNKLWESWYANSVYNYTYTYDANGNMLTEIKEYLDNNIWLNSMKFTYTYDANGNSIIAKREIWLSNDWCLFNYSGQAYPFNVYSSNNDIFTFNFSNSARYEAHFVSFINGIIENDNKQIALYPNPATNYIHINLKQQTNLQNTTVSIYNIQGQQLLQQNISQLQTEINIQSLAKGIYIIKVINGNEVMQGKFVKK